MIVILGCSVLIGYGLNNCNVDKLDEDKSDERIEEEKYIELNSKLFDYFDDIYNNDEWMNGNVDQEFI